MQISVQQLKKSPAQPFIFTFTTSPAELDLLEEGTQFAGPVNTSLQAIYHNGSILLHGEMRASIILECSRCLHLFPYTLEVGFKEEVQVEDSLTLDVTELLREHYFAGFPQKPLCQLSCKGLCAVCGMNQNEEQCSCQQTQEDSRLSILKNYFT